MNEEERGVYAYLHAYLLSLVAFSSKALPFAKKKNDISIYTYMSIYIERDRLYL